MEADGDAMLDGSGEHPRVDDVTGGVHAGVPSCDRGKHTSLERRNA
jgi:hypothetical protein